MTISSLLLRCYRGLCFKNLGQPSLVSQGFNWIQERRLSGRIIPEEDPHQRREHLLHVTDVEVVVLGRLQAVALAEQVLDLSDRLLGLSVASLHGDSAH